MRVAIFDANDAAAVAIIRVDASIRVSIRASPSVRITTGVETGFDKHCGGRMDGGTLHHTKLVSLRVNAVDAQ